MLSTTRTMSIGLCFSSPRHPYNLLRNAPRKPISMTLGSIRMNNPLTMKQGAFRMQVLHLEPQTASSRRTSTDDIPNDFEFADTVGPEDRRVHLRSHGEQLSARLWSWRGGPVVGFFRAADDSAALQGPWDDERPCPVGVLLRDVAVAWVGDQHGLAPDGEHVWVTEPEP